MSAPAPFLHQVAIEFEDVDMYGVVHHPRYLYFLERSRVALFRELGLAPSEMDGSVHGLVVKDLQLKFRTPGRFADGVEIETRITRVRAAHCVLSCRILRIGHAGVPLTRPELLVEAELTLVCVARDGRPVRFTPELRSQLLERLSEQ